mgnify:CR=1 FL=1
MRGHRDSERSVDFRDNLWPDDELSLKKGIYIALKLLKVCGQIAIDLVQIHTPAPFRVQGETRVEDKCHPYSGQSLFAFESILGSGKQGRFVRVALVPVHDLHRFE